MDAGGCYTVAAMRRISASERDYRQRLGDLIRRAREDRELTQAELGDLLGVTRATVSNIEKGKSEPLAHHIAGLHDYLNIALTSFLEPPAIPAKARLSDYLVEAASESVGAAALEMDRRQRERRVP